LVKFINGLHRLIRDPDFFSNARLLRQAAYLK
jgi:hypothetical protein